MSEIIHGNCLEVLKSLDENSIDAIITDPPFGIGFKYNKYKDNNSSEDYWRFFQPIFYEIMRVAKPGAFVAIWQAAIYFKHFWEWYGDDIHIYAGCKNFVQLRKTPINYAFDPIVMFYKQGKPIRPEKPRRNVDFFVANTAKFVTEKNSLAHKHPCPRPLDQVIEIIENFSLGTVLDPFIGSGTTALACQILNRDFIGIEIDEKYIEIAEKRLQAEQPLFEYNNT